MVSIDAAVISADPPNDFKGTAVAALVLPSGGHEAMTNFAVYMIGVIVAVCALAYGAHLVGVSNQWIGVGAAILTGLGIMGAIVKTRRPQSS